MRFTYTAMILVFFGCFGSTKQVKEPKTPPVSFHGLTATDIAGKEVSMARFKGKKVLVVNTASKCGYTPQYAELQQLHERFADSGLVVIGFPSNDFLQQEPGEEKEIAAFCEKEYGVTFPMMAKVRVKGKDMHPVYTWLTDASMNGALNSKVRWNFQKYLIDEEGRLLAMFPTRTTPLDTAIVSRIRR